ncbi:MAG: glycosyltransferase, partial [archaeon]|nr:glycosyltransferase [archaeon]
STDKSFEKLKKEFQFLKTIKNEKNKGFPYALNQGYRSANGFYLVPLNNDAVVLKGWLSEAVKVIESDERIAVAGCTEVSAEEANDRQTLKNIRGRPNVEKMTLPVAWVTTTKIVEKIGYMDTGFFSPIYGEEADWNFRARKLGYRVIRVSKSNVIHLSSQDTKKILGNKKQFILMNLHRHRAMLFNLSIVDLLRFAPGLSLIFLTSFTNGTFFYLLESYWLTLKDWRIVLNQRKKKRAYIPFKEPTFTVI